MERDDAHSRSQFRRSITRPAKTGLRYSLLTNLTFGLSGSTLGLTAIQDKTPTQGRGLILVAGAG